MRYTIILILLLMSAFTWINEAKSGEIDEGAEALGHQLRAKGYNGVEVAGKKAEYINQYASVAAERVKHVHIGTAYQELLNIWSGFTANTSLSTTAEGTVMTLDYDIPTADGNAYYGFKERHTHIVYTVANGVVVKANLLNGEESDIR